MATMTVADSGDHLLRDGAPFVLCADTVWAAFVDARPDEWEHYLRRRRAQGFNALLVSVLPILHDRSVHPTSRQPFRPGRGRRYDYDAPDEEYFASARRLTEAAVEAGFTPMLVALWTTYVPETWGSQRSPDAAMSEQETAAYLELLTATFAGCDPIYVASGDDRYDSAEAVRRYGLALDTLKRLAPDSLTTIHSTPNAEPPPAITSSPALDFYCYQSGHHIDQQDRAFALAGHYLGLPVRRPVVNAEPCYEGHGYGGGRGRFGRDDVRRATWWSLLGGASAGIGYGAHGVWPWHRPGGEFTSRPFSGEPFRWQVALELEGAHDVGLARALVSDHALYRTGPRQQLLAADVPGVRVAASGSLDTIAVYVPHPFEVTIGHDLGGYRVTAWNLAARAPFRPRLRPDGAGATVVDQPDFLGDAVYVFAQ